ncbi:MAG: hypothetical protein AAFV71_32465 [Cyanobacteria bacterium J06633_8]
MSNYTNTEIHQAVTVLKSQGLSNQDILAEAEHTNFQLFGSRARTSIRRV